MYSTFSTLRLLGRSSLPSTCSKVKFPANFATATSLFRPTNVGFRFSSHQRFGIANSYHRSYHGSKSTGDGTVPRDNADVSNQINQGTKLVFVFPMNRTRTRNLAFYKTSRGGRFRVGFSVGILVALGSVLYFYYNTKIAFAATPAKVDVVLLSCGSFNPPTIMHLRMFELARDYLLKETNFRVVAGVLSPVHYGYGKKGLLSTQHRTAMLRLATKNSKWLCVDDWEANQPNYCRTLVVLRHTRDEKKRRVMLLCGADLLKSFNVPGIWQPEDMEEILRDFGVVVITRPGTDLASVIEQSDLLSRYQKNIYVVTEKISNHISSTKIRQALSEGESVRYFVPGQTLRYIYEHGLYGSDASTYSE